MAAVYNGSPAGADVTEWLSVCSASCCGLPVTADDNSTLDVRLAAPGMFTAF